MHEDTVINKTDNSWKLPFWVSDRQGKVWNDSLGLWCISVWQGTHEEEHGVKKDDSNMGHVECEGSVTHLVGKLPYTESFMSLEAK